MHSSGGIQCFVVICVYMCLYIVICYTVFSGICLSFVSLGIEGFFGYYHGCIDSYYSIVPLFTTKVFDIRDFLLLRKTWSHFNSAVRLLEWRT